MKTLVILFTLFYFLNALAVAPYGFKGQNQTQTLYSNVLQFPNNQVTNLGGINALAETGNNNILSNPSFEHLTFDSSWTNAGIAVDSAETTNVIHGKKAVRIDASSETVIFRQDSTLYAFQFADGVQGLASVRVKSDVALKVCSRQAGTTSASNCVDVVANNKWSLYKVPMILGATSNGINIASTGLVTGTVYIDDAFVGATDLTQNINACNNVNCETEFSVNVSATGVVSGENLDWISSCTNATTPVCTFNTGIFTVAPNCWMSFTGGDFQGNISSSTTTVQGVRYSSAGVAQAGQRFYFCQKQGADFTAAKQLSNGNTYSSTNADTDWASCGLTGSAFTGFGSSVPTPALQCKRQGSDLLIKGTFQAGTTPTAVEARMALPTWNGVQLVSANSSIIPRVQLAGNLTINLANTTFFGEYVLIEASVPYVTFALQSSVANADTKATGANLSGTGNFHSINARIPIEGWQQSNIIIGQFNGLESCTSTLDCTDTFSAKVSAAGVVSDENVSSFINGNCTVSSGLRTCTLGTSLVTNSMNCAVSIDANNGYATITTNTSSTLAVQTSNTATVSTAYPFEIICQKQGVDYIGKTAKAVASDQSLRVPGTTNYVTYMASLECDNASQILHQDGNWISSIGNIASGQCSVVMNASKFANANYRCSWGITISQSNGGTGQIATVRMLNASKTTTGFNLVGFFNSGGSTVANTDFTIDLICTGQAP